MNRYFGAEVQKFEGIANELRSKISDLELKMQNQARDFESRTTKLISDFFKEKEALREKLSEWKGIWFEELRVREAIMHTYQKQNQKMAEEIHTLKDVIKIPRTHFKNLEKLKYDEIVEQKILYDSKSLGINRDKFNSTMQNNHHSRAESTSLTFMKDNDTNFMFPRLHRRRSRMKNISELMRNKVSPVTHRINTYESINLDAMKPAHERSVEDQTTFDSKMYSPGLGTIDHTSLKDESKRSLYSIYKVGSRIENTSNKNL